MIHENSRAHFLARILNVLRYTTLIAVVGVFSFPATAQQAAMNDSGRDALLQGKSALSELEKENLTRVAASALQIKQIVSADPGMLVELKKFVAQEASDNGQVLEDGDLTDQAIFDRLASDIKFRSVATALLQRYGYLKPTPNPASDFAREQQLILQERARRFAQTEALEENHAFQKNGFKPFARQDAQCNSSTDKTCAPALPGDAPNPQYEQNQSISPSDNSEPPYPSPDRNRETNPDVDPARRSSPPPIQTTRYLPDSDDSNSLGSSSADAFTTTDSLGRALKGRQDSASANTAAAGNFNASTPDLQFDSRPSDSDAIASVPREAINNRTGRRTRFTTPQDLEPVSLIRTSSPFAGIPSLYDMYVQAAPRQNPERFGLQLFRNQSRTSASFPMDLPVGPDYVVGPGDSLSINVWGGMSQRLSRVVDREGRINLPEAGPLLISGKSLGDVQQAVQQVLRTEYRDVSADVSLSRLRTVRVYVVGEAVEPGAYAISSLSTPLNALFAAGGVSPRGSLRSLKHFRGTQLLQEVDAYELLLRGVQSNLSHFESGDTMMVSPLGPEVTIDGMVRRPAIYELKGEKSLADVVELAGGILSTATLNHIEVERVEAHQKRTMLGLELNPGENPEAITKKFSQFAIQDGDKIHIFPMAAYNQDAIYLQGHVLRPGRYSFKKDMRLTDIISGYKDLLPEPAPQYAEIIRINLPDSHPSVESFDLSAALSDPASAPRLQPLDTIRIFSRYDFEPAPAIWISGEVRAPGKYGTSGPTHLRDAVFLAGGVTEDASMVLAQLFRTQPDGTLKIMSVNLEGALAGRSSDNLLLQSRDRLLIHRNSARVDPPTVFVKGEVAKPGRYPLTSNMNLGDLIFVAGGMKRSAYTETADLTRYPESPSGRIEGQFLNVNLTAALQGDSTANLLLRDGDILTVKPVSGWNDIAARINLRGEFQHPGTYGIRSGETLADVLHRAGGLSPSAYPYGAVLLRREVRDVQLKAHLELIGRVRGEAAHLKALPENDADQKNAKLTVIAQTENTLTQLQEFVPIGRVVLHLPSNEKDWSSVAGNVTLRDGDELIIPKKPNYVMVNGQVFNPTAIGYQSGHSAKWYLSQAGGLTPIADKKAVFVIRADGSVLAAKNNNDGWWTGDAMNAALRPGDTIIVPEKTPKIGGPTWTNVMQAAQLASSIAIAVAYIHP